jgi:hypothetical protein
MFYSATLYTTTFWLQRQTGSFSQAGAIAASTLMTSGRQRRMLSLAARQAAMVSIAMLDPRRPDLPDRQPVAGKVRWV